MEEPTRIPLIIGITGHRKIMPDDRDRLEKQIRDYLAGLRADYPNTPLVLLSSLSEGADRFAAQVAVEMDGVGLGAVLPWPENICADQLHRSGDRDEFDSLIKQADYKICLKLPDSLTDSELSGSDELKETRYAEVSRYITRHCQVMMAGWNGIESEDSHTCKVIHWHREGTSAPFAAETGHLDEPEIGSLIHMPVRKCGDSAGEGSPGLDTKLTENYADGFHEAVANIEGFNRDAVTFGPELADGLATAKSYVIPTDDQPDLAGHLRFALDRYAMADQLAMRFQGWSNIVLKAILGVILLTVASFEIYAHIFPAQWGFLLAYPLLFAVGFLFLRETKRRRINNRYIDYRALSEAMRIHFFWKMAGLPEAAADFYLRSYRSHLDWIRVALRAWSVQSGEHDCGCGTSTGTSSDPRIDLKKVRQFWLLDQHTYFKENAGPKNHKLAHHYENWAKVFIGASLLVAFLQVLRLICASVNNEPIGNDSLTHYAVIAIAMGGVLAGLCHEYMEKRLFEKQARSYSWMASLYGTALKRFDIFLKKDDLESARSLIQELGREALAENAGWVIYHRENEPEMKAH